MLVAKMVDVTVDFSLDLEAFIADELDLDSLQTRLAAYLSKVPEQTETISILIADHFHSGLLSPQAFATLDASCHQKQTGQSTPSIDKTIIKPRDSLVPPVTEEVLNNRFVLEDELGRGGMGIVYKARDLRKEEVRDRDMYVAVKVLNADFKQFPDACIDLQRECKKAQRLAHPNIVTVYDFDRDGDTFYMTMEILEGESLEHLMKRLRPEGMSFKNALPIITGMVQGLSYAHELGIVHSDFKPGNVFVLAQGSKAKILDFGLATAVKRPGQNAGNVSLYVRSWEGLTPAYASPEMCDKLDGKVESETETDPIDDIYGLACVTYELLAGRHPFAQIQANLARDQQLIPKPISTISRKQNAALARALSFNRRQRTPSAKQFLDQLTDRASSNSKKIVYGAICFLVALIVLGGGYYLTVKRKVASIPAPAPVPAAAVPISVAPPVPTQTSNHKLEPPIPTSEPETVPVQTSLPEPVSVPEPSRISPELQARMDDLLRKAEQNFIEGKLVMPKSDNACINYQEVLELDSGNQPARDGIEKIKNHIRQAAQQMVDRKDFCQALMDVDSSLSEVEAALDYCPDDNQLQNLKQIIIDQVNDCLLQSSSD